MIADNMSLGDLLSSRVPFEVPKYQRGYAWDSDEIDDFVTDIRHLITLPSDQKHFFGGIVSVTRIAVNNPGRVLEIVDGQQRLITYLMALDVVRLAYSRLEKASARQSDGELEQQCRQRATELFEDFLTYRDSVAGHEVRPFRVSASNVDRTFLAAMLSGESVEPSRSSHVLLVSAHKKLSKYLVPLKARDFTNNRAEVFNQLEACRKALIDRCHVIHINTERREEAYRLFSVLNDRGRSLSDADLLRTYSLEVLESFPAAQQRVESVWDQVLEHGTPVVSGFLKTFYAMKAGTRPPSQNLHEAFREAAFWRKAVPNDDVAAELCAVIVEMGTSAQAYSLLREGEWPFPVTAASAWHRSRLTLLIKTLGHKACLPLLLALTQFGTEQEFIEAVHAIELVAFRYQISGGHASALGDRYIKLAQLASAGGYSLAELNAELRDALDDYSKDDTFGAALNALQYRNSSNHVLKYFLVVMATVDLRSLDAAGGPSFDRSFVCDVTQLDIEHVEAQSRAGSDVSNHRIGNLTVWRSDENRAAQDAPFTEKRGFYSDSSLRMNRELGALDEWSGEACDRRQGELVDQALKLFRIHGPVSSRPERPSE